MRISIIAAIAENNVIGKNNELIWHLSEDLKRFKKLTSGHPVIMGRKTYESLPFKPLPKRKNIILSSQKKLIFEGAITVNSIEDALKECKNEDEIFICGGAEIYKLFLPIADKMYLTRIHQSFEGDTFFPEIDYLIWEVDNISKTFKDDKNGLKFTFYDYIRNRKEK